jgi:aspartate kinase
MEQVVVAGIAADTSQVKFTLQNLRDSSDTAAKVFGAISLASIVVDIIVQDIPSSGAMTLSFTVSESDRLKVRRELENLKAKDFQNARIIEEDQLAKISVIGVGMQHHPGVASKMFSLLGQAGVNIKLITTSEIKISCLIEEKEVKNAVRCLHRGFELDQIE